ncbi:hypothetical protein BCR33DRAFT_159429 [Rhizoclosmatium globosum]|uniref:Uncharacterized protein n=1 Tax=Rhizoclosmatium globosum TaxID=329046 RepID=A0A1Y2CG63_9FUNG|nr:hypothetical protein BCR33DRAFT_159429 [Rhizoclosmatium globosum]|eukprot:ORY46053.1 hypothetical protein BCR33DRAFT_159429 [Rhizoclosmatium globosum]
MILWTFTEDGCLNSDMHPIYDIPFIALAFTCDELSQRIGLYHERSLESQLFPLSQPLNYVKNRNPYISSSTFFNYAGRMSVVCVVMRRSPYRQKTMESHGLSYLKRHLYAPKYLLVGFIIYFILVVPCAAVEHAIQRVLSVMTTDSPLIRLRTLAITYKRREVKCSALLGRSR